MWAITQDKILDHIRCVDSRFRIQQPAPFRLICCTITKNRLRGPFHKEWVFLGGVGVGPQSPPKTGLSVMVQHLSLETNGFGARYYLWRRNFGRVKGRLDFLGHSFRNRSTVRAVSFSRKPAFCTGRAKNADPTHPRFVRRFMDWGSHGGPPLQENETALRLP